jgi:transposase
MDQIYVIRHKVMVEGLSMRRVAREMGISRVTVKRYVSGGATPCERKPAERPQVVLDRVRPKLDKILEDSKEWTHGKQKLTAARVWKMLREDGVEVGETLVKKYVREWKRKKREVFVPLHYVPGDLGQVDFFEVLVDLGGERVKAWMFVMRLMHSGRDFAWLYPRQDQVSFLDGHVRAFEHFGAVPHRLAYDNLKAAVKRILVGSERELSARFEALTTHYVYEACFCRPRRGSDKGGVEARGKGIRWQHLVPIPTGPDLDAISVRLLTRLDVQTQGKRSGSSDRICDLFEAERALMLPLPARRFRSSGVSFPSTSRRSLAKVRGAYYSVPCKWAGLDVTAYLGVYEVILVLPDGGRVAHERKPPNGKSIDYRHYLPELARKPQALRQVAGPLLEQLGEPFGAAWRLLVDAHGPMQAARVFTLVCSAIVEHGEQHVARRVARALRDDVPIPLALAPPPAPETILPALPASLVNVEVEAGSAADYDMLLQELS